MNEATPKPGTHTAAELEPWMRGTHTVLDPLRRGVVHALELVAEDAERWCASLDERQLFARPASDIPPVAFHLRHIARSLDRLLTYAECTPGAAEDAPAVLSPAQMQALATEMDTAGTAADVLDEFRAGVAAAVARVQAFDQGSYEQERGIGRKRLPTTVGGLLIHCAEHSARHIGQAVTTAKIVRSVQRS